MTQTYKRRPAPQRSTVPAGVGKGLGRIGASLLVMLGIALNAKAQQSARQFFQADGEARNVASKSPLAAALFRSKPLTLDVAGMRAALATAPLEGRANAAPLVVALPLPNGSTGRFALREAPVMAPALAERFPMIKTYAGVGLDDASASVRVDLSPQGFHAQVLTSGGNSFYIDPATRTDTRHYLSFYKRDMNRAATGSGFSCAFEPTKADLKATAQRLAAQTKGATKALSSGSQLRTYRLALANTPEYALTKGNTMVGVMSGKVTTVNRVVGVYEKELAVRLVLVPNNDQLTFLSGTGPQPVPAFTNSDGSALLAENQSNVDRIIGSANYDIGHVVSTGGGGVAYLGVVCNNSLKAGGVTGSASPVGDAFDIDYVAHEIGHQFSGNHTFNNNNSGSCSGNRNTSTAFEPGSGSTIMAYAGICGTANNLQPNSDAFFHTGSYEEMRAFIESTTCGTTTATGNTAPVVTTPASGKTLPVGTPFKLTATATDAENDPLTYSWEQLDLGPAASLGDAQVANQTVPLFRSFVPSTDSTRYFPRLTDLVNNTTALGERLPTVTRTLKFRCTARDEHSGPAGIIGGVNYSGLVNLDVSSVAGPFVVTAPNTSVNWVGGAAQAITWDVAGTTNAPVSCALVNIRLSLDGGLTYPTVLATNEANDGSAVVVAPDTYTTNQTQARIMVEAADNYFFDISNANFTITPPAVGPTITSFTPGGGLAGTVVTILGSNFTGATAVNFNGTPTASFTVNSATQITATVAAGTTTGAITVTAPTGTATSATPFIVGPPPTVISFTPTTGPVGGTVVITGTDFSFATRVTFNGTSAPIYTVNSATQITVTVPAGATTGPIGVTGPTGSGVSAASFTVIPAPVITSFSPVFGKVGAVVVLTGNFFTGATQVAFNGTNAPIFTVDSNTQLTVTVPTGATTGPVTVTGPGGPGSSTTDFTVITVANDLCADALPLLCGQTVTGTNLGATTFDDPTASCLSLMVEGAGVFYTITGTGTAITLTTCNPATNFDTQLFVYRGACNAYVCNGSNDDDATCSSRSRSTLTFNSVLGTVYRVFVNGYDNASGNFTLTATCAPLAPTITSVNPTSGAVGSTATITGTNLTGATNLTLNGVAIPGFTVVNATTITFTVPVGATTGNLVVTTPGGVSAGTPFTVVVLSASAQANQTEFSVWPNPVAGKGTLHVALAVAAAKAQATLRNVVGQTIATRAFSGSTAELSTTGLAAGTYLLTVQTEGRVPSIQRVVVE
ncbi:reprolysin-like metallopeptidase [Hymenobacter terrenus]|uniref:reprolysin-like metallopeptidase n=1 Tax=Hymenobacter terrenus TaxID=1629124 RepID=UPI0018CD6740|nr:M12 family metallo-peptidase [Hymenobacter terrenus]